MRLIQHIPVWGDPVDEGALAQLVNTLWSAPEAAGAALMADHHLGYAVPIGGVVAYRDAVSPSGVGFDIGCGNKAVRLKCDPETVKRDIAKIMDEIVKRISFGMGRNNGVVVEHPMFDKSDSRWDHEAVRSLKRMAQNQLGTVGGGNHYVDVMQDDLGDIWVGCHFGSRGLGHKTATWFLKKGGAKDGINATPLVLSMHTLLGQEYVECMKLAGEYAYAGRDWVCAEVARIIGAEIVEEVHNHHNFAWQENHRGENLWVVRKGATPAFPGQRGFIGGSMGDPAYIVEGRALAAYTAAKMEQALGFFSTVHGAGRAMSRTKARGKTNRRTGEVISPGEISHEQMDKWLADEHVELRGGDLDEAPQAYKRIEEVLAHHIRTVKIIHELRPLGVAMAGRDVIDHYKD
jgi:tRNA-splicing ligase RtcB